MFFNGLPEMNIENINLENAFITARYGAEFSESKDIILKMYMSSPRKEHLPFQQREKF